MCNHVCLNYHCMNTLLVKKKSSNGCFVLSLLNKELLNFAIDLQLWAMLLVVIFCAINLLGRDLRTIFKGRISGNVKVPLLKH